MTTLTEPRATETGAKAYTKFTELQAYEIGVEAYTYPVPVGHDGRHAASDAPVGAFWSVTMYDAAAFQAANEINRFPIVDRDAPKVDADGSLDLYIQHKNPGPDKVSNWPRADAMRPSYGARTMSRMLQVTMLAGAFALAGCTAPADAAVDPHDPAITATIDSLLRVAMDGATRADADRVLEPAAGKGELTFLAGNVIISGLGPIRETFRKTYSELASQQIKVLDKRIRVLSPDVAIATLVEEGTYTDKAGWTSEPVDIGLTLVFVKENGQWRIRHAHQSITR